MKDFLPSLPANRWLFFFCCFVFLNLINCCYYFILACLFAAVSGQLHQAETSAESWDFLSSWDCFLVVLLLLQRSTLKSGPPANQSDALLLIRIFEARFSVLIERLIELFVACKARRQLKFYPQLVYSVPLRYGGCSGGPWPWTWIWVACVLDFWSLCGCAFLNHGLLFLGTGQIVLSNHGLGACMHGNVHGL